MARQRRKLAPLRSDPTTPPPPIDPRLIPFAEAYGDIVVDAVLSDPRIADLNAKNDAIEALLRAERGPRHRNRK